LTARRAIIMLHGARANRADPGMGLLDLSASLARHGFAVLAFDMRGMGESSSAPLSMGYYEQRDVLGAVDFLRAGALPYPHLGRPGAIGGWGVSMGAATLLMAAAREAAIRAVVADSAYADIAPIMEHELPARSGLPGAFTPGILLAVRLLYGIDYHQVRPIDGVARIAPRPLLIIQGADDSFNGPAAPREIVAAARRGQHAHVQMWIVPGAPHGQSFHVAGDVYVRRVVSFFDAALGRDDL
jgi:pimeloyl-ACP methyl ester carboxylesterase